MKRLIGSNLFILIIGAICIHGGVQTAHSSEKSSKPWLVGFAQDTMSNDWRIAQVKELEREFKQHPSVKFFYTNAKGETARQIKDIEDMINMKVDVLITSPRDAKLMTPVISTAYQKGIPVVLISRRIESDDFTTFIHPDNRCIAVKAAQYIVQKLEGKGKVFILQHIPTSTPAIHRTESFLHEIKKHKDIHVSGMKVANSLRSDAIKMTEEALREGLEFDAIYAQSDSMASGARLALKKAGMDLSKIVIVGIDYISEAREAIRRGEQDASFTYPTGGKEGAEFTMKILQGEKVPKEFIIKSLKVTQDNVEAIEPIF